ncbi:MAG: S8 family serine peptidase, partial [Actinomycetota bacterium]|nr:S8 family serine peptidase [Actinomycetota bacterium]
AENAALGYAVVRSSRPDFAASVDATGVVEGAARNRVIGTSGPARRSPAQDIERLPAERALLGGASSTTSAAAGPGAAVTPSTARTAGDARTPEPLAARQWDMRQIGATPTGSYAVDKGRRGVLVGIIDTGVDGSHPDIAPNFDASLSHNFVTDNPVIDGPCEVASCVDPADVDDNGHGTHVASTIASPANGLGIAGVAPGVTVVNLRAGQDSGYFFLQATLEALTYAGDIGVDVVNMSFYVDPWLFNCTNNPADSPAERSEQRVVRTATQRAVSYAVRHGVLPVAAEGNEATDLGHPTSDLTSPDFPAGVAHPRTIDNSCLTVPTETEGVFVVSATGPSTRKAYYSNYGTEQTDVAAPGGDAYDTPDNTLDVTGLVLAAYPKNVAEAEGTLNPDGTPNTPFVVQDCRGKVCGYYQYLQGTSMAAPHAAGVAALAVSHLGTYDSRHGGLTLAPAKTAAALKASATATSCPQPRTYHYTRVRLDGSVSEADATCQGGLRSNGFYGSGIVSAYGVVTSSP